MSGTLIGVGVGPGDPELMTLKAARILAAAKVVAYPSANGGDSRALRIAADHINPDAAHIDFALPMRVDRDPAQSAYDKAADQMAEHLAAGQDVVVLCEGDPLFFGSFMYLAARLNDRFETHVVPGITSVTAASAALTQPMAARGESVGIVSATADTDAVATALDSHDTLAIMKVGRHFDRVRGVIEAKGQMANAAFVANASCPDQIAVPLAQAPDTAPYFSLILVTKGRDPWLI